MNQNIIEYVSFIREKVRKLEKESQETPVKYVYRIVAQCRSRL